MKREATTSALRVLELRATFLVGLLLLLFVALLGRYFHLMVLEHDEMLARSRSQTERTVTLDACRGTLLDRHGHPLALTRQVPSVAIDPSRVPAAARRGLALALASALDLDAAYVYRQLVKKKRFRWLKRQITDPDVAARVEDLVHPALDIRTELARCYPAGAIGAQLVGFTNSDGTGIAGAEQAFHEQLTGRPGERVVLRDGKTRGIARGRREVTNPCRAGLDVVLAMDLTIQTFAEEALAAAVAEWEPEMAVAVVLDPRNGDVLALAGSPSFDPAARGEAPARAFRIPAVTDTFEIGSTMKPLIVAAALKHGAVGYDDVFDCSSTGSYRIGSRTLHDHKPMGVLALPDVIVRSSNIGMAQVAEKLGVARTYRFVRALGFGESTGTGLPGEEKGMVFPRRRWDPVWVLPSVAMGHDIMVTPLQFAAAFASLVNGGILHRPRIALRVGGEELPPRPIREVVRPEVARDLIVPALVRVVTEGSWKGAKVPGYAVGGKTGTAQIKAGGEVVGYASSFVGFAPAEDPRFLALVLLRKPTRSKGTPYGGRCAAPCVGEILSRCLKYAEVPPSRPTAARPVPAAVPSPGRASPAASTPRARTDAEIDRRQLEEWRRR